MVLPLISIVVMTVKSVYLIRSGGCLFYEGGIPYYYNYNIKVATLRSSDSKLTVREIRAVRHVGPERRVRGILSRKA